MVMETLRESLSLLKRRGAMLLVPDLVEAVAGEPVKGTWWAHKAGPTIYRLANELEDHEDVVVGKLAGGKVTFVHARLFSALARVVTDEGWRKVRSATLDADTKKALARIEKEGRMRADAATKKALEPTALVRSFSEHSEGGKHITILESWRAWMKLRSIAVPKDLSFDDAHAALAAAGIDLDQRKSGLRKSVRPPRR
jgi:hypothetical protein